MVKAAPFLKRPYITPQTKQTIIFLSSGAGHHPADGLVPDGPVPDAVPAGASADAVAAHVPFSVVRGGATPSAELPADAAVYYALSPHAAAVSVAYVVVASVAFAQSFAAVHVASALPSAAAHAA